MKNLPILEVAQKYAKFLQFYYKERDEIETQIKKLSKKLSKLSCPSWVDMILKPIAESMVKSFPDRSYDILGPFGMTHDTAIHFYKKDGKGSIYEDDCKSIRFRPGDLSIGEVFLVNYSTGTPLEIPIKKSIKELLVFMNEQEN